MFSNVVKDISVLSHYWWKFKNWLQDIVLHRNLDKLKLSKKFTVAHQFLKKNSNQFYLKFFNLEIQFRHVIFMKDYYTRFLKSLQNLMNQHDYEYFIIQNVITHADKLWQSLNREKICLKFKKKIQHQYKNFDQHCCDDFWSQD